ncbi:uncharacterized protein LOC132619916 [Lycium barbarum]|uniref:uncharacterized protein LOC132619916 n=1 Tax=Lycium barbarum TaxID=112863 RepID=UPI00293EBB3F|nr:uncharacterized protein LOC132619916 [Lycium barbarum]
MSRNKVIFEINRNLWQLAKFKFSWLDIPHSWPLLVQFLEKYKPQVTSKAVAWNCPPNGWYKCNTDGAYKSNTGQTSSAFCIRNSEGNLVHAWASIIPDASCIVAEAREILERVEYCVANQLFPLIVETDSLLMTKVLNDEWEIPYFPHNNLSGTSISGQRNSKC